MAHYTDHGMINSYNLRMHAVGYVHAFGTSSQEANNKTSDPPPSHPLCLHCH